MNKVTQTLTGAVVTVLLLVGCGSAQPPDTAPPVSEPVEAPSNTPDGRVIHPLPDLPEAPKVPIREIIKNY